MSNDIETRDKAILDAISQLSGEIKAEIKEIKIEIKEVKERQGETEKKIEVLTEKIVGISNSLEAKIEGNNHTLGAKIEGINQTLGAKIEGINQTLGAKIDGIDKRVGNLEFLNRVDVSSLIAGIIALIVKIFI